MQIDVDDIAQKMVDKLRSQFDAKGLNDTGAARASIGYRIDGNKIIIEGLERALFLNFGRRPGTRPPVEVIEGWVRRKLNVPEDQVSGVAYAIAKKIGEQGTDILTDRAKGLQIEIVLAELEAQLHAEITNQIALQITNGLITTWQSPK